MNGNRSPAHRGAENLDAARGDRSAEEVVAAALAQIPRPLDLRALGLLRAPPREWSIDQWMLRQGRWLLAGAGGSGKSLLGQQTATAQAIGRSFVGTIERPCSAMVWNCEDDEDEMWRRQEDISDYFGIALADAAEHLTLVSRVGCENVLMAPILRTAEVAKTNVFELLRQQVNDLHIESLYLDNLAYFFGGDENSRTQATTFLNALSSLVSGRPFSVGLLAHTARHAGSEFAGSAAWENAVRMRWYFGSKLPDQKAEDEEDPADNVRYLAKRKANYSAKDHVRMTITKGSLMPDMALGYVNGIVSVNDDRLAEGIVIAGFKSLQAIGIAATDGKNSPDYLPRLIVDKSLGSGYGKHQLARAMNRLMGQSVFVRGPIGRYSSNRTQKQGLILQAEASLFAQSTAQSTEPNAQNSAQSTAQSSPPTQP